MKNREYENLKFKRTYLGGSKKKEFEIFKQVQNIGGECDWTEYKRILLPYLEDVAHVRFSRAYATKILSVIFLVTSLLFGIFHFTTLSIIIVLLSILFRSLFIIFDFKSKQALRSYDLSFYFLKNEIKKSTGLEI